MTSQAVENQSPTANGSLKIDTPPESIDTSEKQNIDHEQVQDGGVAAWLRVLGAFFLFMISWGPPLTFGAFQIFYESDLLKQYSASRIAWIGGIQTFLLVSVGIIAGPLYDRGFSKPLIFLGCFLVVFGTMMLSLCTKYYQVFLAQGVCSGIGSGLIFIPGLSMVAASFIKYRSIAVGITMSGSSIGGIIFPILFRRLQPRVGFPWTVRTLGFIFLALATLALALIANAPKKTSRPRRILDIRYFKEAPYTSFALAAFCQYLAYWIPLFYIPTYASLVIHSSASDAFYMLSIFNAGNFLGRLSPIVIPRSVGAIHITIVATIMSAILLFVWIAVKSFAGYIVWCILLGFSSGVFVAANPVVVTHPVLTPNMAELGTRMGIVWFGAALGALIGSPIAGALVNTMTANFLHAQIFAGCIMTGGVIGLTWPVIATWRYDKTHR